MSASDLGRLMCAESAIALDSLFINTRFSGVWGIRSHQNRFYGLITSERRFKVSQTRRVGKPWQGQKPLKRFSFLSLGPPRFSEVFMKSPPDESRLTPRNVSSAQSALQVSSGSRWKFRAIPF